MDLVDAFASFEFARQARDAAVGGIGDFGEEKRNIEPQLVTHDAILFCWRSAMRSGRMLNARQDEVREPLRDATRLPHLPDSRKSLPVVRGAIERGLRRPGFEFKIMRGARLAARSGTELSCDGVAVRAPCSSA
jgi:hypothetical protein